MDPAAGAIALDGVELGRWSLPELPRRIAYVEQDAPLLPVGLAEHLRSSAPAATRSWRR